MGAHGSQTDVTWLEGVFQPRRPSWILSNNFTVFWEEASRNSLQFKMILLEINNRVIEETLRAKFTGWDCTLCSILLVEVYKWSILANVQIYKAYAQLVFSFTQREVWVGGYNSGRCVCFLYIFLLSAATDERNHEKITTEKPIITKGWTYPLLGLSPWKPSLSSIYGRGNVILCQLQLRVRCEHCGLLTFWRTDKFCSHNSVVHVVYDKGLCYLYRVIPSQRISTNPQYFSHI